MEQEATESNGPSTTDTRAECRPHSKHSSHKRSSGAKHKAAKQVRAAQAKREQHQREAAESAAATAAALELAQSSFAGDEDDLDDDSDGDDAEGGAGASSLESTRLTAARRSEWSVDERLACLDSIVHFLRRRCSREGTSPGDATSLYVPGTASSASPSSARHGTEAGSWFAGANACTAFFLDDFLYSRADFTRMIDEGSLDIFYCTRCERVLKGECRPKKHEERQREEAERRALIAHMRAASKQAIAQQHSAAAHVSDVTGGMAVPAAVPSSSPPPVESASPSPPPAAAAVGGLANVFALLATRDDTATVDGADVDDVAAPSTPPLDPDLAAAAQAELDAALAALPPINPYLYPRNNAQPRYCRYCHAPSGALAVRTHLTHSLSVQQSRDMFDFLVTPHIDWAEGIGSAAVTRKGNGKLSAASGVAAAAPLSTYAVDIGSRLGNMLYAGVLWSPACPLWLGVELDAFFAAESARVLRRWGMSPSHARVLEGDITAAEYAPLLRQAKLVCFFNCFELHVTRARHRELLRFLRDAISQRAQYILSCPSLHEIFARAESDVDVDEWVEQVAHKDDAFIFRVR